MLPFNSKAQLETNLIIVCDCIRTLAVELYIVLHMDARLNVHERQRI